MEIKKKDFKQKYFLYCNLIKFPAKIVAQEKTNSYLCKRITITEIK